MMTMKSRFEPGVYASLEDIANMILFTRLDKSLNLLEEPAFKNIWLDGTRGKNGIWNGHMNVNDLFVVMSDVLRE